MSWPRPKMNWKLVFLLSLFGLTLGLLTISLIPSTVEPFCWLIIFIVTSITVAKKAPRKYFLHGFLVSLLNGIWLTGVHVIFFDTYVTNHPEFTELLSGSGVTIDPRLFRALTGPVSGMFFGVVLGLFCWLAAKILKRKS